MTIKKCTKCDELKPYTEFSKCKANKDGMQYFCISCRKQIYLDNKAHNLEISKNWYKANKDRKATSVTQWKKNNKNKVSDINKKAKEKRKDKAKIERKIWLENNPTYHSNWAKQNRAKLNARDAKRFALEKQAVPPWFEQNKVALIYKKAKEWGFEVDHVIPLQGKDVCGLHCWANLQLLAIEVNRSKGNREYPDH